jgi:hypothetical protein
MCLPYGKCINVMDKKSTVPNEIAYEKHRKKKIFQLEQDERTIVGESNIRMFITEYYK